MSMDILSLINQKQKNREKENPKPVLMDVNQDLIVSLLALPLYGKVARDEEILSVIINAGTYGFQTALEEIRKNFNEKVKNKEVKKGKDGMYRNKEGFIVLRPW